MKNNFARNCGRCGSIISEKFDLVYVPKSRSVTNVINVVAFQQDFEWVCKVCVDIYFELLDSFTRRKEKDIENWFNLYRYSKYSEVTKHTIARKLEMKEKSG